jgi:hypothetical protein
VNDGGTASFSATAVGDAPLSYQWFRDGKALSGATHATYTTGALALSDTGSQFSVSISNAVGTVTSASAQLVVKANPPVLLTQPQSQSVTEGQQVLFSVAAGGSPTLSFQWSRDGQSILGATSSTYLVASADLADDGSRYSVTVSNAGGDLSSSQATLTVKPVPLQIAKPPTSTTVGDGDTATFQVEALGSGVISYQWLLDGHPIIGATARSYSLPASMAHQGRRFSVTVSSPYGSATSEAAVLTVVASLPSPPKDMKTLTATVGEPMLASVAAGGTPPFSYQWQRSNDGGASWKNVDGATAMTFRVAQATLAWAQVQLRVQVSNAAGTVASAPVVLKVSPNVRILAGATGGIGYADGVGAEARFGATLGISLDLDGSVLVADQEGCVIRRVKMDGQTSLAAGIKGDCSFSQPPGPALNPKLVAVSSEGRIFTSDGYSSVYRLNDQGLVERFSQGYLGGYIRAMLFDTDDSLLAITESPASNGLLKTQIKRLDRHGRASTVLDAETAGVYPEEVGNIRAIALDANRNIFVAGSWAIWRVDASTGQLTRWAGKRSLYSDCPKEGPKLDVCLSLASSVAMRFDDQGNLVFLSYGTANRIDATTGQVRHLAGTTDIDGADVDGPAGLARLPGSYHSDLLWHPDGQFIFTSSKGLVRAMTKDGAVTTLAGKAAYASNVTVFGKGDEAQFVPGSLSNDAQGFALMFGGTSSPLKIDAQGTISAPDVPMPPLGSMAWTRHADGTLYYLGGPYTTPTLYKVSVGGGPVAIAGGPAGLGPSCHESVGYRLTFSNPTAMIIDGSGDLLVADKGCQVIFKMDLTTRAIKRFTDLQVPVTGFAKDIQQNIVFLNSNQSILKLAADGTTTPFVAPSPSSPFRDGFNASFKSIAGMAFDDEGNLYVTDPMNGRIRRIAPNGYVTTVMGDGTEALRPGIDGSVGRPQSLIVTPGNRMLFTSESAIVTD